MKNLFKDRFIAIFLSLLLLSGLIYSIIIVSSPEYALNKIYHAYVTHDTKLFNKYVDKRSLVMTYLNRLYPSQYNVFGITYGDQSINKQVDSHIDQMDRWVQTGFSKDPISQVKSLPKDSFNLYKSVFYGVDGVKQDGKIVVIGMKIFHPRYDTTLVLDLNFREKDNHWELYDIPNLQESINTLDSLEYKKTGEVYPIPLVGFTHFLL